ncbi:MAG: phosphopantothenoylcysteine decarboxylase [Finegoldia magna]|nr:phosphopantothenoylcysteine decarboxylase [Finegoldia magna]
MKNKFEVPVEVFSVCKKLDKKNLDFIVLNDVSKKDIGFNSEYNKVTVISKDNILEIDKDTKLNIADKILDLIK